jgi:hypothetical protein
MKACLLALIWLTAAAIARRDVVLQHTPSTAGAGPDLSPFLLYNSFDA